MDSKEVKYINPESKVVVEFEKNASGYFWRLREATGRCIAVAARDYETSEEAKRDFSRVSSLMKFAKHVWLIDK